MPNQNFPGPTYTRLIDNDPQIVKVPMDTFGWGSRMSIFAQMGDDPRGNNSAKPRAPEMTVQHVQSKG